MELERWEWIENRLTELGAPDDLPRAWLQLTRGDGDWFRWTLWLGAERRTSRLSRIGWRWPKNYGEYRVDMLGVIRRVPTWPVAWPAWTIKVDGRPIQDGDEALEPYLQMAYRDTEPLVLAELRWYPEKGISESAIRGADQEGVTREDVNHAWRALRFLCQLPINAGGRPKGTGQYTSKEDAERAIRSAVKELRERGEKPTQHNVARYLNYAGDRAVRNLVRDWELDWNELRKG